MTPNQNAEGQADADGWIAWSGGRCPLPPGTMVAIRTRYMEDGDGREGRAATFNWQWFGYNSDFEDDIIAYRIAKPQPLAKAVDQPRNHTARCWGRTSLSEEVAHCYCATDEVGEAVERLTHILGLVDDGLALWTHGGPQSTVVTYADLRTILADHARLKAREAALMEAEQSLSDLKAEQALDREAIEAALEAADLAEGLACLQMEIADALDDELPGLGKQYDEDKEAIGGLVRKARARLSKGAKDV